MSDNKNENVVIAFYATTDAAEAAVEETPADVAMDQAAAVAGPAAGILGVAGAEAAVHEQL